MNFLKAFLTTAKDFCRHSSLHGFKYLLRRRNGTLLERCFWAVVQVFSFSFAMYFMLFSWYQFVDEPTVIIMENLYYPARNVQFPGVSICDLNKISLKKVETYANELASRSNCSVDTITRIAKGFGKLYDFAANALDNEFLFSSQMFLDTHDLWEGKKFNVYQTLKKLSPSCDELISNCCWDGVDYNCTDLFVFEVTIEGFCCIFNFVPTRHNHTISNITTNIIKSNKNKPLKGANLKGLSLTLHHNVSDYFYPLLSSTGATVDIFNANDIPDVNSGGLHYRLIPVGVEIYLKLGATVVQSMPEIKKYSVTKRKCIFPEESRTMLGDKYSYSDCLLDCRIRSIMSLCECIPFTYVTAFNNLTMPQCNLLHTACLDKYQHKWRRYYPYGYHDDDIEIEKQDSLQCENCVPTCHNTFYTVTNDFTYIYQMRNSPTNLSRVHIFFSSVNAKYYKHDVIFYWYEILSNFGGTCGLTMGLSLIGVVEFFYYFSVRLVQNWIFK